MKRLTRIHVASMKYLVGILQLHFTLHYGQQCLLPIYTKRLFPRVAIKNIGKLKALGVILLGLNAVEMKRRFAYQFLVCLCLRFRSSYLSLGGGYHPSEVFRQFRGRDPSPDALLWVLGLKNIAEGSEFPEKQNQGAGAGPKGSGKISREQQS